MNENAKLKVKQNEDSKLWQGLDSKISSTKTLCDQLTETLQQLASQTEQGNVHGEIYFAHLLFWSDWWNNTLTAEEDKKFFEEMLGKNSKALDEFNCLLHDLSTKLECAEQKIIAGWSVSAQSTFQYKLMQIFMEPKTYKLGTINFDIFCTSVYIDMLKARRIHNVLISLKWCDDCLLSI